MATALPSTESNFADPSQGTDIRYSLRPSGINSVFPSPKSFKVDQPWQSGVYKTYPPAENDNATTAASLQAGDRSEFEPNGLANQFSNGLNSLLNGITNFTAYNPYIHYYPEPPGATSTNPNPTPILIPYVSDYTISPEVDYDDSISL
jgi:hypothetical protein